MFTCDCGEFYKAETAIFNSFICLKCGTDIIGQIEYNFPEVYKQLKHKRGFSKFLKSFSKHGNQFPEGKRMVLKEYITMKIRRGLYRQKYINHYDIVKALLIRLQKDKENSISYSDINTESKKLFFETFILEVILSDMIFEGSLIVPKPYEFRFVGR